MSHGIKQTLEEGYNKFVVKNSEGCWDWSGCCPANPGYGQFRYGMKKERAHRASWIIHFGKIPKGICVLHKCDNKRCSNPEHLFLGTRSENIKDMLRKGRHPTIGKWGEQNHMSKLTAEMVRKIKLSLKLGDSCQKLADIFNVSNAAISKIKQFETWKELQ